MRAGKPFVFTALRHGEGVDEIVSAIVEIGGLALSTPKVDAA
jgi:urease accessory protein